MAAYSFQVNGSARTVETSDPDQPLLYVLRNAFGLHGAKFGCGLGQCGACTVLVDGKARALLPDAGLGRGRPAASPRSKGSARRRSRIRVQAAFIAEQAAQCGYCTNGMIMTRRRASSATADADARARRRQALAGNLCRCGTHTRILRAVLRAAQGG